MMTIDQLRQLHYFRSRATMLAIEVDAMARRLTVEKHPVAEQLRETHAYLDLARESLKNISNQEGPNVSKKIPTEGDRVSGIN